MNFKIFFPLKTRYGFAPIRNGRVILFKIKEKKIKKTYWRFQSAIVNYDPNDPRAEFYSQSLDIVSQVA